MIKAILVCTDGSDHSQVACDHACSLTDKLGAKLTGLHVLDSRMLEGPLMADISGWIGAQPYGGQLQQLKELLQERGETVIKAFLKQCKEQGVDADGSVITGHPAKVILAEEVKAELVIIGQRGEHASLIGEFMGTSAERIIRHSLKPCMITPATYRPIRRVLAAYDGSAHASRALHEAIELAQAGNMTLTLLTIDEKGRHMDMQQVSDDGLRLARAHDMEATGIVAKGYVMETILQQADKTGTDLIVIGAQGHSRIHEMLLGSTTMQLIAKSDLPVLLVR